MKNGRNEAPLVEIKNLSINKEKAAVLSDLNFRLYQGETHAVVSLTSEPLYALCDLLRGEVKLYEGMLLVRGESIPKGKHVQMIQIIGQDAEVFPYLSIVENILLTRVGRLRWNKKREEQLCEELLRRFGIQLDLHEKIENLSVESRRIVQVLRTYLNTQPVVVLFDPFKDLDIHSAESITKIIDAMKAEGRSIILLTNQLEDACKAADRVSLLCSGMCRMTDNAENILRQNKEAMYILSGWVPVQEDTDESCVLDTIVNARDILSSSTELKKELLYLAKDIAKVLSAQCCIIYLLDQETGSMIDIYNAESVTQLDDTKKISLICRLIAEKECRSITLETKEFAPFFVGETIQRILFMPVDRGETISGLIQVSFASAHTANVEEQQYLNAFSREIAIAIETSRLIGRSMLVQESHHRIKNNLQMIVSLVYMQKIAVRNQRMNADEAFDAITRRVRSIAKVHDLLSCKDGSGNISNLRIIICEIVKLYETENVNIAVDVEDISIPYNKATSVTLVVNELLNNCVKHAFSSEKDNRIWLVGRNDGRHLNLTIADNGVGFFDGKNPLQAGRVGAAVVTGVVAAMNGTIEFENRNGACVSISIPISHVYEAGSGVI